MSRVIADQTRWGKLLVGGGDRLRFLQGMLSNDLGRLAAGEPPGFIRAALLNVKGRVLAVVEVVLAPEPDAFLVLGEPATTDVVRKTLERHAIVDDVTFTPVQRPCHRVWDDPAAVWTAPPIFAPPALASSDDDVEIRRVEAGLPAYGVDVSEDAFPFEANLDSAISYDKGCYIGQEVVARAHARGHANRRLVGLRLADSIAAAGAIIAAEGRPDAGAVTSSVLSPLFGPIALGYVHRSAWAPGTRVTVGGQAATVAALPFAAG